MRIARRALDFIGIVACRSYVGDADATCERTILRIASAMLRRWCRKIFLCTSMAFVRSDFSLIAFIGPGEPRKIS